MSVDGEQQRTAAATALAERLRELHVDAGMPSLRAISAGAGPGGISHNSVNHVLRFTDRLPTWPHVKTVVTVLGGDIEEFQRLWKAAVLVEENRGRRAASATRHTPSGGSHSTGNHSDGRHPDPASAQEMGEENASLKAELGALKERLAKLEQATAQPAGPPPTPATGSGPAPAPEVGTAAETLLPVRSTPAPRPTPGGELGGSPGDEPADSGWRVCLALQLFWIGHDSSGGLRCPQPWLETAMAGAVVAQLLIDGCVVLRAEGLRAAAEIPRHDWMRARAVELFNDLQPGGGGLSQLRTWLKLLRADLYDQVIDKLAEETVIFYEDRRQLFRIGGRRPRWHPVPGSASVTPGTQLRRTLVEWRKGEGPDPDPGTLMLAALTSALNLELPGAHDRRGVQDQLLVARQCLRSPLSQLLDLVEHANTRSVIAPIG